MLAGRRDDTGAIFVTEVAPPASQPAGGVAIGTAGAIYAKSVLLPQVYANGFGLRNDGALCIAYGGTIRVWQGGLPFTDDGRLVCQLNQPVAPGDSFVGGIRVGPLGGVYVTDVAPPPFSGFDAGFDAGFGA